MDIKKYLKIFLSSTFLKGSLLMLLGTNLHSFGLTVFHLIVGRFLGRSGYADVAVILSVLGIVAIVQQSFGLTIVKFVSSLGKGERVINFTRWIFYWSLWLGVFMALFFLALSPFLVKFLHISQPMAIYILSPTVFLFVFLYAARSILQGLLRFGLYVFSLILEVSVKLVLVIPLVIFGYGVFGAMAAIATGVISASVVTFFSLYNHLVGKRTEHLEILPLLKYSVPVFLFSLALTSMYSTDIILVKHFFSTDEAGLYAALAKLGSIAFFGAAPIAHVMFPMVARNHSKGEPYGKFFYLSLLLVLVISGLVVIVYRLVPELVIGVLFGSQFVAGANILWWFGVYMLLVGLATLLIQFYLSVGKTRIVLLFVFAALSQGTLIWFIHPALLVVIQLSILLVALLVLALLVYFPYHNR